MEGVDIYAPGTTWLSFAAGWAWCSRCPCRCPARSSRTSPSDPGSPASTAGTGSAALVKDVLEKTALWDEVKDRLDESGLKLSGGQQQRLCLARILALRPEFILLDEPTSGLDPVSTMRIEEMLRRLKAEYTIVLVTNNTKQAARVADRTAFFLDGELVEVGDTVKIFSVPSDRADERLPPGEIRMRSHRGRH